MVPLPLRRVPNVPLPLKEEVGQVVDRIWSTTWAVLTVTRGRSALLERRLARIHQLRLLLHLALTALRTIIAVPRRDLKTIYSIYNMCIYNSFFAPMIVIIYFHASQRYCC